MRAAHSLKGAARIVDIDAGVALAHAMEDFFVAAQQGRIALDQEQIDLLLQGVDLMMAIAKAPDLEPGQAGPEVDASSPTWGEFSRKRRCRSADRVQGCA